MVTHIVAPIIDLQHYFPISDNWLISENTYIYLY
jgi:hypothetical protein